MTLLLRFLQPIWRWIFGFFISLAISNAVMWLLRYSISELTEKFSKEIEIFIHDFNQYILETIINVDVFLDNIVAQVFERIDLNITEIEAWFALELADAGTAISNAVSGSVFLNWVEKITQSTVDSAGKVIKAGVQTIIDTVLPKITDLETLIGNVNSRIAPMENDIYEKVTIFRENLIESVQEQVNQINDKLTALLSTINILTDSCNANLNIMEQRMDTACTELGNHSQTLDARKTACLNAIRPILQNNNIPDIRAIFKPQLIVDVPDELYMDFSRFRVDAPDIDEDYFYADITLPPNNFQLNLDPYLPDLAALGETLSAIQANLENPGQVVVDYIDTYLPALLSGNLRTRIKNTLIIILTQSLQDKLKGFNTYFDEQILNIRQMKEDNKQTIITKRIEITKEIQAFEQAQYDKVKPLLNPAIQTLIDDLSTGIVEDGDENETLINIDDVLPDTQDIDHILERFDATILANPEPNISDSAKWSVADMYRLLCNYFHRSERVALLVTLLNQDLNLNTDKLHELQSKFAYTPGEFQNYV